jgi:hypothetical protein
LFSPRRRCFSEDGMLMQDLVSRSQTTTQIFKNDKSIFILMQDPGLPIRTKFGPGGQITLLCPNYLASCKIRSKFMGKIKDFNPLFFPHLATGKVQKFAHC